MNNLDPEEFVGTTQETRAEPASRKPPAERKVSGELRSPGSHAKHSIAKEAREYADAVAELALAQKELMVSKNALALAEKQEDEALAHWQSLQEPISTEQLLRDNAVRSNQMRADNVRAGLPPGGVVKPSPDQSPISVAARNRPRSSPQMPSTPLRSPIARRTV
jgi:hypothetical protein